MSETIAIKDVLTQCLTTASWQATRLLIMAVLTQCFTTASWQAARLLIMAAVAWVSRVLARNKPVDHGCSSLG